MPEAFQRRHIALPSWLMSMVLHLVLILALGLTLRLAPPPGAAAERTAEVGIVLKHEDGDSQQYQGPDDAASPSDAATIASVDELLSEPTPSDPTDALPSPLAVIGPGALSEGGVGSAIGADRPAAGAGRSIGGEATTGVFGIQGTGHKFAYVFDRSGSMGGSQHSALAAAKAELIASLGSLEKTHQFQIIFYSDDPRRFNPTGQPNRLFFATEQNKALAAKFVGSITAEGATRHKEALLLAIKLQPDVIFFLTDADEPKLGPAQLAEINRKAAGITINTIEFGLGPQMDRDNFLMQIARQNGGKYGYVDVTKLSSRRQQ